MAKLFARGSSLSRHTGPFVGERATACVWCKFEASVNPAYSPNMVQVIPWIFGERASKGHLV
jgi:hypothetical protein